MVFHDRRLQYMEHQQLEGWRWNRPGDRILDIGELTVLMSRHTLTLGKNGTTNSSRASSTIWPDHTWNPGDDHSAVRLKVKCGPHRCKSTSYMASSFSCQTASSTVTVHLHIDADNNSSNNPWGKRKALLPLQTRANSQIQLCSTNMLSLSISNHTSS